MYSSAMAIVVSLLEPDLPALRSALERNLPLADLVELRLDLIGHPGEEALRDLFRSCSKPVIVTVHGKEGFGEFEGSREERFEILHAAARAGADFVDIDWRWSLDLGEMEGKCHRIVSRHILDGTPEDLDALHEEQKSVLYEGDIIKLVTHAECHEDGLRMLRYLRAQGGGLIAFCSGEAGSFTRLLAPIFGSPFTYAAPKGSSRATAPGQLRVNDMLAAAPPGGFSPETAILGIVGRPVTHSWSPLLHNMALKAANLDAIYLAFEPQSLENFLELADDENFRGFSITAPFKQEALRLAKGAEQSARAAGAANTLVREGDGWMASNTDVTALRELIEVSLEAHRRREMHAPDVAHARVLVIGAGGAARSAAQATREVGAHLLVSARRDEAADQLAADFAGKSIPWDSVGEADYHVLVHCTPAGGLADPGNLPFDESAVPTDRIVIDANYRPLKTPLLLAARDRNCTPVPGGEWFVRQALAQFKRFTKKEAPEALMRSTFEHAYGDERKARGE
ncbi:MAG: 3-dehydroquinate dehydratase/shikimate dehydrogenase [Candidatus Paceibacteria bacterium]|jgi:3-dehydroquinate dehydratase/shikimate dehydrogenase